MERFANLRRLFPIFQRTDEHERTARELGKFILRVALFFSTTSDEAADSFNTLYLFHETSFLRT